MKDSFVPKTDDEIELDLDEEIDDQIVLASLTGVNTLTTSDEKKSESNLVNLEELDYNIPGTEELAEAEIVGLACSQVSKEDDIEIMVEPLNEVLKDTNEVAKTTINDADELSSALDDQLKITCSSTLLAEPDKSLSNVKEDDIVSTRSATVTDMAFDKGKSV